MNLSIYRILLMWKWAEAATGLIEKTVYHLMPETHAQCRADVMPCKEKGLKYDNG